MTPRVSILEGPSNDGKTTIAIQFPDDEIRKALIQQQGKDIVLSDTDGKGAQLFKYYEE